VLTTDASNYFYYLTLAIYCFGYYLFAGLAVNVAYHRCLSHRSFQLWKPLERFFVTLGLPAGTPVQWAGNHRFHHGHADEGQDPHSPARGGFWHAHVGWYIGTRRPLICFLYSIAGPLRTIYDGWNRPRTNQQHNHLAADVAKDDYYRFLSRPKPFMIACWLHVALFFGAAYFIWGAGGFAALWITAVIIYNLGDAIDSIAHLYGERPFEATHLARNNRLLGILTLGEGWHANHHVFPGSARHGLLPNQFDGVWEIICLLKRFGMANEIRVPTAEQIQAKLITPEKGQTDAA
jgi:stearoyl-CoA desaturase (delta-9 desaturase)